MANISNHNVSWSSSDTAIAKIDAMGLVTGIASGSVTITASTTFNSKSMEGLIKSQPTKDNTETMFDLRIVMEYYSR